MTSLPGMTWDTVEETMTLPRYYALCKYWEDLPPSHVTAARFANAYLKKADETPVVKDAEAASDLVALFGANIIKQKPTG